MKFNILLAGRLCCHQASEVGLWLLCFFLPFSHPLTLSPPLSPSHLLSHPLLSHPLTSSLTLSPSHPLTSSLTLSPSHPLTSSLTSSHPLTLSPPLSPSHLLSHPLTSSLTLSPSHPLTLSPSLSPPLSPLLLSHLLPHPNRMQVNLLLPTTVASAPTTLMKVGVNRTVNYPARSSINGSLPPATL